MTDSRDKPELETLSYRNKECPSKPSSKPMGFNSCVIKPETRANKAEDASQHPVTVGCPDCETPGYCGQIEQPKCKMCNDTGRTKVICRSLDEEIPQYVPCKYCYKGKEYFDKLPEQPNKNLMIIEEIEGLMSQVNEKIHKLTFSHDSSDITKKQTLWSQALEEIDLFQKTTLFELRKAFE